MYIVDFAKYLMRKSNIPIIIYLIINVVLITGILSMPFAAAGPIAILIGLLIYLFTLTIAISPIGEIILRKKTGCDKITDPKVLTFIEPIFMEVYKKAKRMNANIPDDVDLYMNDSEDVNAFATGRRTVCITKGLLRQPPELIKATLGHEMGHLGHHDTDLLLIITVGNVISNIFFVMIQMANQVAALFIGLIGALFGGETGVLFVLLTRFCAWMTDLMITVFVNVWTWLGTILVMKSSRGNEYEADEFSFNLGYGYELCRLLDTFPKSNDKGLFATLQSSHPDKDDRINRLRQLGVKY